MSLREITRSAHGKQCGALGVYPQKCESCPNQAALACTQRALARAKNARTENQVEDKTASSPSVPALTTLRIRYRFAFTASSDLPSAAAMARVEC